MKIKISLLAILLSIALFSCKKERTCVCTTTYGGFYTSNGQTYPANSDPTTTTTTYEKVRKSEIATSCGDSKSTYNSTSTSSGNTSTNNSTSETKCEIK